MKIMASGLTTSWEIDGETVETVSDFIFLGSKITTDGDCSHEIRRPLLPTFHLKSYFIQILKPCRHMINLIRITEYVLTQNDLLSKALS